QGYRQLNSLDRVDDPLGDDIASHDPAEDIDQDGLHVLVGNEKLEGFGHLLFRHAAANVEKVGRAAAIKFDNVHCRHGEAGTVHEAGDIAIEPDVIETVRGRLDLPPR